MRERRAGLQRREAVLAALGVRGGGGGQRPAELLPPTGWDDSVSVTDPRKKTPILRRVAAREWRENEKAPPDAAGQERAIAMAYQPARWPKKQVYLVLRRDGDGEQRLLVPVCTVMLVSYDRLSLAELVRRHRGQQGRSMRSRGR